MANETFEQYSARLLSLSAGKDGLTVLATTAPRIGMLIARCTPDDLRWTTSSSRWSIAQIVRRRVERDSGAARWPEFVAAPVKAEIDAATLDKLDVRVGTIRAADPIPATDRLAVLTVDFGDRTRSIVAGIRTERSSLASVVGCQALY